MISVKMTQTDLKQLNANILIQSLPELSFQYLIPKYLDYAEFELNYSKETLNTYRYALERLRKTYMKDIVSVASIDMFRIWTLKGQLRNGGKSDNYQNITISALRSFLSFSERVGIKLAIKIEEIKKVKVPRRQVVYLNKEEIGLLLSSVKKGIRGARFRALAELLLGTGMRISEALSLTKDQITKSEEPLKIVGKGKKERYIFLSPRVIKYLDDYLILRNDTNPALFVTFGSAKVLCRYDIHKSFRYYSKAAGLNKRVTPHILRHTAATIMLQNGCPLNFVSELLGHSDIKTTVKYYVGTDVSSLRQAHERYLRF